MAQFLKEIYLTAFIIFFRAGGAAWTAGINAWKGIVGIAVIEGGVLVGIASWINILVGKRILLDQPKWAIHIVFLILCFANYYALVARGHGLTFESSFSNLKKFKKILLLITCAVVILVAIAFFIYSASVHRKLLVNSDANI